MNKLTDSMKEFKERRRSAGQIAVAVDVAVDELEVLAKMYEAINTSGQVALRQEFSSKWDRLSEQKKAELVDRLLKKDLLPPQVEEALRIFNGKIVSLL